MGNAEGGDEGDYEDLPDDRDSDPLVYALRNVVGSQYVSSSWRYGFCLKKCIDGEPTRTIEHGNSAFAE
jgi:hypothetical protein